MNQTQINEQTIVCSDHITLAATLFRPSNELKGAVLIGPATGIKRQFYASFASYLCDNGYGVLTFENLGIGESNQGLLTDNTVTLQSWGEKDLTAAFEHLKAQFPDAKYHLVGHSAGGQLIGLMPNAHQLSSVFNFACSSGCLANMSLINKFKAHFFMNFFIPLNNLLFGHTKSQLVGMGEPLPKQVARQWRHWCNGSGYVKMAFGRTVHQHWYDELAMPSMWVNAVDDYIAINENVADMISVFSQMPAQTLTLDPKDHDLSEIGHMKFFSRQSQKLWPLATDWLSKHA
ncbi:alpha/beta hydrolase family protein [Thalassotalea euphylliae]|uniref:Alpha/beta fold hydrolase n=1 Tax=Thalassotalea euphylliae TaxID=1655234 RepID=A0A3E0U2S6_9GAMM|nr:alpha/beta fold hydrolase [Thalassotalea euphylliae]REL30863.1 alpha/beta fold hydrolase [Thalassotalea euphylliae]